MTGGGAAGWVLAAGAIAVANDALFAPLAEGKTPFAHLNWRIVPATGILAVLLTGLDKLLPGFGSGLAKLVLFSVLVIPYGNAPTPLETLAQIFTTGKKVL